MPCMVHVDTVHCVLGHTMSYVLNCDLNMIQLAIVLCTCTCTCRYTPPNVNVH